MLYKLNNSFLVLAISLLFTACNGGQLKEVLHDSTKTRNTRRDSTDIKTSNNEFNTVQSDSLSTESRQFIAAVTNDLGLQINISKAAIKESGN
ncbi:MAG: hypothetical protein ABIW47_13255 [Ginsengibacter sp.]